MSPLNLIHGTYSPSFHDRYLELHYAYVYYYTTGIRRIRGYIVLVFSVKMCVLVCMCLCVNFFPSKISQELLHLGF